MKKQIIISSLAAATIWSGTAFAIINTTNVDTNNESSKQQLLATNSTTITHTPTINHSKNETVFVTTDETGQAKSKFIGNTLYSGTEDLPFNLNITYFLNDTKISAQELAGKSGHIKIVFNYDSVSKYNNKYIPFVAVTGVTLDHSKFNNLNLVNGKIIEENSNHYIIAGYSITGINKNLGTNFLPQNFILEADVNEFKLENTYTIFTNDILADIDTSKLNQIDELVNSVSQLENGINELINGSTTISNGLLELTNGTTDIYEGSKALTAGTTEITKNANLLASGLNTLVSNNGAIQDGASAIANTILSKANDAIKILKNLGVPIEFDEINSTNYQTVYQDFVSKTNLYQIYITNFLDNLNITNEQKAIIKNLFKQAISAIESIKNLVDLNLGIITYTNNVATIADGASKLANAMSVLEFNTNKLSAGLGTLVDGETKLYEGSVALNNGLKTFKTAGIDKLVNFASKDLNNFVYNFKATLGAANSYKNFGDVDANSVKFIVKTPTV